MKETNTLDTANSIYDEVHLPFIRYDEVFSCVTRLHDLMPAWKETYQWNLPWEGLRCGNVEVKHRCVFLICTNLLAAVYANLSGVYTSTTIITK